MVTRRFFSGFFWVLLGYTWINRVLLGFTRFSGILLGFTGFLFDFTRFYWFFVRFYSVLLRFTVFSWIVMAVAADCVERERMSKMLSSVPVCLSLFFLG